MDTTAWWYVNGVWVHPQQATLSINDLAIIRGYCAFETLRTYDQRPFCLREHVERLARSAGMIDLVLPHTQEEIASVVHEITTRNAYRHAMVRLLVTGGESEDGIMAVGRPKLIVMINPLGERDWQYFAKGRYLITTRLQRETPEAKTSNYISAVRALKEVARRGADDALFVNEQGHVQETTRGNFFLMRGDTLITAREGILHGVTRNVVLKLARGRFTIEERPILLAELAQADEAFMTSSSREITPVVRIDEQIIGSGQAGPRTTELEQRFVAFVERGDWSAT